MIPRTTLLLALALVPACSSDSASVHSEYPIVSDSAGVRTVLNGPRTGLRSAFSTPPRRSRSGVATDGPQATTSIGSTEFRADHVLLLQRDDLGTESVVLYRWNRPGDVM